MLALCFFPSAMLSLLVMLLIISFRTSRASFCGRRGEAISGKCDLPTLPAGLKVSPVLKIPNTDSEDSEASLIFEGLPFSKVDTCAVVGLSEGMLKCRKGAEIDAASIVFRLGFSPLQKFKEHVGTKVNVTLCRSVRCYKDDLHHRFARDLYGFKWTVEYKDAIIVLKDIQKPTYGYWNTSNISNKLLEEYEIDGLRISPSTGFQLSVDLLASKKCESVHVYGLGGGLRRYHYDIKFHGGPKDRKAAKLRKQNMKRSHSQDIETDIFKRLKQSGYRIYKHDCIF